MATQNGNSQPLNEPQKIIPPKSLPGCEKERDKERLKSITLPDGRIHEANPHWKESRKRLGYKNPERFEFPKDGDASLSQVDDLQEFQYPLLNKFVKNPGHIFFYFGGSGVGKSFLAKALYNYYWFEGFNVRYITHKKINDTVLTDQNEGKDRLNIVHAIKDDIILIIDDLFKDKQSDFNGGTLFDIVESRGVLPTIYTSNFALKDVHKQFLVRETGLAVQDRFSDHNNLIFENWSPSRRRNK